MQEAADYREALEAYERALGIDERVFGPDHPNVARDVNNLGLVLQALGELPAAREAYERALGIFRKWLPEGNSSIKTVEGNLEMLKREMEDGGDG